MDSFWSQFVHQPNMVLQNPSIIHSLSGKAYSDIFFNFYDFHTNAESQFSSSNSTFQVDAQFMEIPHLLSFQEQPDLILRDLTNWNADSHQVSSDDFDALLTSGNAQVSPGYLPLENENPLSPFYEEQTNIRSSTLIPSFPGAEGFGAISVGGRGGRVIEVTNLYDKGPGSLRAALETEGPRIVVFRVGGTIRLQEAIQITNPYLTVAGQTAPGGGILLRGTDSTLLQIKDGSHDVIIRYLRLRNGSGEANGFGYDNISIDGGYNIILDHISMSWSTDENAEIYRTRNTPPIYNVTIQRSSLGEGLAGHSNGLIVSGETDFSDPDNPIEAWREIYNISIHHNLFIHNTHRNPRVTSSGSQVINNVIYNWKYRIGETTRGSIIDVINNYAKAGPVSNLDRLFLHENSSPEHANDPYPDPSIYTKGNVVEPVQTDSTADNWNLWKLNFSYDSVPQSYHRSTPLQQAPIPIKVQSADAAYDSILTDVGANARLDCQGNWIPNSDSVDQRYLLDIINHRGYDKPIARPYYAGGYPDIKSGKPCSDTDQDGMPDEWENLHQFNLNNPSDGSADADGDGYTNVEEYLNGT